MRTMSLALRHELVGLSGVIERNIYLVKRYIWWDVAFFLWTVANTLTIVFIAKGIPAVGGTIDVEKVTTILLLLDEPTTGLDPRSKQEVQEFIREVRAEHDATVLLCTHDLAEAETLADRVGILDNGKLLCLEPADELKARYGAETLEEAFFAASGHAFENGHGGGGEDS